MSFGADVYIPSFEVRTVLLECLAVRHDGTVYKPARPFVREATRQEITNKDVRSTGNGHDTRPLGDNLGVRKHKRERESCYNNRRGDEAAEVDGARAVVLG